MIMRNPLSQDARARGLALASAKRQALAELPLKTDWLDSDLWNEIAAERGLKLPIWQYPPTNQNITRWLRKLDIRRSEFLQWGGYAELSDFARLNPTWPLRALVGVLLEYASERDAARGALRAKLHD